MRIDAKADVNAKNKKGNTALMVAASMGNRGIFQLLLDAKADINVKNDEGNCALFEAVENDRREVVQMLIDAKAKIDVINYNKGDTHLLTVAAARGHKEVVQMLIDAGAFIDAEFTSGLCQRACLMWPHLLEQ